MRRLRLDELLVARGFYPTRSRARDAIQRGTVEVGATIVTRPSAQFAEDCDLVVEDAARAYVSRAALKLIHALDQFGVAVSDLTAIDIGASTGGFTQALLKRGVRHVTAVDVGHGQLDARLANDRRVTSIEGTNIRSFDFESTTAPDIITADVSFISLKLALPNALQAAKPGAKLVALIKPQFEAGREALGKGGIVSDPNIHLAVCNDIDRWIEVQGWKVLGVTPSPLLGGDGNAEFLIAAEKPC